MDGPISSARRLADLVDYQDGSVVSRVVLRNEGGVMTIFAFAEGEGLTEHANPNDAVIQVLEGSTTVLVADERHVVREGESLHLPPSIPHTLLGGERFKMLLTLLKTPRDV